MMGYRLISTLFLLLGVTIFWTDVGVSARRACVANQTFTCNDGKCIPISWKCDGDTDCSEGEDEQHCSEGCGAQEFECSSRGSGVSGSRPLFGCIPDKWRCDGEYDCEDHSDEKNCPSIICKDDQFKCSEFDGQFQLCIPLTWKCDGQKDCASGDDEKDCQEKKCANDDFQCSNGVCIFKNWRCDGEDDCGDKSDEHNCTEPTGTICEHKNMFKCKSGGCIPNEWKCDGESDCMDHSDEKDCKETPNVCKLSSEFACKTGRHCINRLWVCDGESDCPDESDEADCTATAPCAQGEKKCPGPGNICFPESSWCNGVEDCPDGSDEEGCPAVNVTEVVCNDDTQFKCPTTPLQCVQLDKLCTKKTSDNCGDDTTCAKNITLCTPNSDNCLCRNSYATGAKVCHCARGYRAVDHACHDINECETIGICDQLCVNVPGSYHCNCHRGYKLSRGDGSGPVPNKCRALGGDPLVLLSNRATIRQFDLVTNVHQPLIQSPGSAVAMDFHLVNGTLVWSDISLQQILMCKIGNDSDHAHLVVKEKCSEGDQSVVYSGQVHTPDGLAMDWVHNLLFWTDGGLDQINVMDLATRQKRVLFNDKLEEPRAIAVDPELGLIFWTDWGSKARIERAGMDGSHRTVIVSGDLVKWPNGLALDMLDKRVYWADAKVKSIFSANYWGHDIKVVLHSHSYLRHPFSLSVFEDRVYFTDWEHDGVITVNKFTGGDVRKVMSRVTTPMTVRIYHKQAQPQHENKCDGNDCGDNHMCLPIAAIKAASKEEESKNHYTGIPFRCVCAGDVLSDLEGTAECISDMLIAPNRYGFSKLTMFCLFLIGVVCVTGYMWHRGSRGSAFTALNFDNPVYRRTVEQEMEDPFRDPFRDEQVIIGSTPTQIEQPSRLVVHEDGGDRNTIVEPMNQHLTAA